MESPISRACCLEMEEVCQSLVRRSERERGFPIGWYGDGKCTQQLLAKLLRASHFDVARSLPIQKASQLGKSHQAQFWISSQRVADVMAIAYIDGHQHPATRVPPGDIQNLLN